MKKFERAVPVTVEADYTPLEKPKLDLMSFLPQILNILPNINLSGLFSPRNRTQQTRFEVPFTNNPQRTFVQKQNKQAVIKAMEEHNRRVRQIRKQ